MAVTEYALWQTLEKKLAAAMADFHAGLTLGLDFPEADARSLMELRGTYGYGYKR